VALPAFARRAAVRRVAIDRYFLPAAPQQQFAGKYIRTDGQTDEKTDVRTPDRCIDPALHPGSAKKILEGRSTHGSTGKSVRTSGYLCVVQGFFTGIPVEETTTTTLHLFNGLFSRTTWASRYQKGKTSLDLNETRDDRVLGRGGISWTICKQSAPRSRQITTPTPHH